MIECAVRGNIHNLLSRTEDTLLIKSLNLFYDHQGCFYLIKNIQNSNISKYYYNLKLFTIYFLMILQKSFSPISYFIIEENQIIKIKSIIKTIK